MFWIWDLLSQFVEISLTSQTTISGWSCCHWDSFICQRLSTVVAWIVGVFNLITSNLITPLSPTIHAKVLSCANTLPQTVPRLEAEFGSKVTECSLWHWFGKEVCYLLFSGDMLSNEKSKCNSFAHKMVIQLDVFATSMKHRIYYHVKSTCVICGFAFFTCAPTRSARLAFYLFVKNWFLKKSWSRHLFYFYFWRENKTRNKTLKKWLHKFWKSVSLKNPSLSPGIRLLIEKVPLGGSTPLSPKEVSTN